MRSNWIALGGFFTALYACNSMAQLSSFCQSELVASCILLLNDCAWCDPSSQDTISCVQQLCSSGPMGLACGSCAQTGVNIAESAKECCSTGDVPGCLVESGFSNSCAAEPSEPTTALNQPDSVVTTGGDGNSGAADVENKAYMVMPKVLFHPLLLCFLGFMGLVVLSVY